MKPPPSLPISIPNIPLPLVWHEVPTIDLLVPFYLMAAYADCVENDPIMPRSDFAAMRRTINHLAAHIRHPHLGYIARTDYPTIVQHSLAAWRKIHVRPVR